MAAIFFSASMCLSPTMIWGKYFDFVISTVPGGRPWLTSIRHFHVGSVFMNNHLRFLVGFVKLNNCLFLSGVIDNTMSEEFKRQRSTSLQVLRSLGYGKHNTEGKIQEEAAYLMNIFKGLDGKPFDPAPTLMVSVSNVICSLLYGRRYDHSDQEYQYLLQAVRELICLFATELEGDSVWLYRFKPSYRKTIEDLRRCWEKLSSFNQKKIDERRERIEREDLDEPSDFIEGYLKELKPNSKGEGKMAEDWLIAILDDFFVAGTETTSTTLTWAIVLMAACQDVQKKACAISTSKLFQWNLTVLNYV